MVGRCRHRRRHRALMGRRQVGNPRGRWHPPPVTAKSPPPLKGEPIPGRGPRAAPRRAWPRAAPGRDGTGRKTRGSSWRLRARGHRDGSGTGGTGTPRPPRDPPPGRDPPPPRAHLGRPVRPPRRVHREPGRGGTPGARRCLPGAPLVSPRCAPRCPLGVPPPQCPPRVPRCSPAAPGNQPRRPRRGGWRLPGAAVSRRGSPRPGPPSGRAVLPAAPQSRRPRRGGSGASRSRPAGLPPAFPGPAPAAPGHRPGAEPATGAEGGVSSPPRPAVLPEASSPRWVWEGEAGRGSREGPAGAQHHAPAMVRCPGDPAGHGGAPWVTKGQGGTPGDSVGNCGAFGDTLGSHCVTPVGTVRRRGALWDAVGCPGTPWDARGHRGTRWDPMRCQGMLRDARGHGGTSWGTWGHFWAPWDAKGHRGPGGTPGTLRDARGRPRDGAGPQVPQPAGSARGSVRCWGAERPGGPGVPEHPPPPRALPAAAWPRGRCPRPDTADFRLCVPSAAPSGRTPAAPLSPASLRR